LDFDLVVSPSCYCLYASEEIKINSWPNYLELV